MDRMAVVDFIIGTKRMFMRVLFSLIENDAVVAADSGFNLPDDLDVLRQRFQQDDTADFRRYVHRRLVAPVFYYNHRHHGLLYAHAYTRSVQSWNLYSFLSLRV